MAFEKALMQTSRTVYLTIKSTPTKTRRKTRGNTTPDPVGAHGKSTSHFFWGKNSSTETRSCSFTFTTPQIFSTRHGRKKRNPNRQRCGCTITVVVILRRPSVPHSQIGMEQGGRRTEGVSKNKTVGQKPPGVSMAPQSKALGHQTTVDVVVSTPWTTEMCPVVRTP